MPPAHIAVRTGGTPRALPTEGSNMVYVQLYSAEGRHVNDFQMDEYKYLTTPPPILRQGQNRYWCWVPRHSQYREGPCADVDVQPALLPTLPEGEEPPEPPMAVSAAAPAKPDVGAQVRVPLYTWDGEQIAVTPMLESVWYPSPPAMIRKGSDYFGFHPRFSQYRGCECMPITLLAVTPSTPTPPQTAVPGVNSTLAMR